MVPGILVWLAASLVLYAVVVNGVWMLRHSAAPDRPWLAELEASRVAAWARGLYLLGIPVLALALRVPGLRAPSLGLPPPGLLDKAPAELLAGAAIGLATAFGLAAVVGAAVAGGDRWFHRSQAKPAHRAPHRLSPWAFGLLALDALCLEAHWAFFRAGLLSLGLINQTLTVYLSLGLLGLEAWVNPAARAGQSDPEATAGQARTASLAVLSMSVFLATGSSLACLAAHLAATTGWALAGVPLARGEPAATLVSAEPNPLDAIEPTVV